MAAVTIVMETGSKWGSQYRKWEEHTNEAHARRGPTLPDTDISYRMDRKSQPCLQQACSQFEILLAKSGRSQNGGIGNLKTLDDIIKVYSKC